MKKILAYILAAIIETALIIGSLYIFDEASIVFCIIFIFLLLVIPLLGYYIIKEKKPIWILIILIALLPLSYLGNMGITKIQEKNYNTEIESLMKDNKPKVKEMADSLKTLLENDDEKGLKEIFTEDSINKLTDKLELKNIKFDTFGEDADIEAYDNTTWEGFGTGSFTCNDEKYYIDYSVTGTPDSANYLSVTILPWDLYEKASKLTEESDEDEVNALYKKLDENQIYLESIYSTENSDLNSTIDFEM